MSSSDCGARRPHAVCVPYPTQGHVTPMMQLAKLLHSRGFYITFVNTHFNHKRLLRSKGPNFLEGFPDFQFQSIPDGLPDSDTLVNQDVPLLCDSTRKNCLGPFQVLLDKLNSRSSFASGVPPVTCIVSDGVMSFAIKAAEELGIPEFQLWTASTCSFMGYLHFEQLKRRGIIPFQDEDVKREGYMETPIDWIPGLKDIRYKDIPKYVGFNDPNNIMYDFMGGEAQNCLKSPAILFNTFDEFEKEVLDAIAIKFPNIYTIGPLHLLGKHMPNSPFKSLNLNLWTEDTKCFGWLNKWEPSSVVYVNYGSVAVLTDDGVEEFAWGLANSGHPFLWVIRPDVAMGKKVNLPNEFFDEIKDRGLLVSWCLQDSVLSHASIGAFLTHCGWNSTLESISAGVPVICWPFFADQHINCRYACTTWGIGLEVSHTVRRDELEALVKEMMEGERGKQLRNNAKEWKRKAEEATDYGGSSYINFGKVIRSALRHER